MNKARRHIAVASYLLVILCPCRVGLAEEGQFFLKGPYLQNLLKTSVQIVWEGDRAESCKVEYWDRTKRKKVIGDIEKKDYQGKFIYVANLKNLKPYTQYQYQAFAGTIKSPVHVFKTFPDKVPSKGFAFAFYGDVRNTAVHTKVAKVILERKPDFVLTLGDLVNKGKYPEWGPIIFSPARELYADICMYPARGNHDGSDWYGLFFPTRTGKFWYSFTYGNATFIALDSCQNCKPGSQQGQFLEKELKKVPAGMWKIVFLHHPPYSHKHTSKKAREQISPVLSKYKVDLALTGHYHSYERSKPQDGVVYIVSGGSGAGFHGVPKQKGEWCAFFKQIRHYGWVEITKSQLKLSAVDLNGEVFDSLILKRD